VYTFTGQQLQALAS